VFGNYYGTPKAPVDDALATGRDVLFDIDWQGTQQLRDKGRADLVTVFILPPSTRDLEKRLLTRAQDLKEIVAQRMAKAADEMSHWAEYDYVVINTDIDRAFAQVQSILAAERLKRGEDFLFDIDWQGTQQLHAAMGEDLVRVFILPPSMQELDRRLHERGTDTDEVIAGRMQRAAAEISHWAEYDYVLINEDMDECLGEVRAILAAERLKRWRQAGLVSFVRDLVAGSQPQ